MRDACPGCCAARSGALLIRGPLSPGVPALRCTVKNAAPRPGHWRHCFTLPQDDGGVWLALRANRLDIVAIGVDQERRKIGRAVIGPRAGLAIVAASGLDALCV